ncbi:MAG TPA: FHA domain-containing protein [Gaiellaceae bacterium]
MIAVSTVEVEELLLGLKVAFLVVLYVFIWRIVRTASKDLRLPQESFILDPEQAAALRRPEEFQTGELVVLKSPALAEGERHQLNSAPLTIGRSVDNDVSLDADTFASTQHARVEPRRDGVWLEDIGSTNGTFLNGAQVSRPRRLTPGDVIRVGETDLRFEQ